MMANSKQERDKKEKAKGKCLRQYEESLGKILKENEILEKKMENALMVRGKEQENRREELMRRTR